jgi:hypothetical protein
MSDFGSRPDLDFRMGLLERAVAENARRLGELAHALDGGDADTGHEPQTIIVDADSVAPFAAGFHFREFDATGRPYRWTGKGDFFELRVALDRKFEWAFELDLRGNDHVNVEPLRVFADYVGIPLAFIGSLPHFSGTLPTRSCSSAAVLTFYLPVHFVPSRLDPSSVDHRSLSAVFYDLRLVPRLAETAHSDADGVGQLLEESAAEA